MNFAGMLYTHKKLTLAIVIAIALVGLGYYWVENNREFVVLSDEQLEELGSTRAVVKYYERLSKAYENDTFGGSTPEETLAFFVEAMRANDAELAFKYFFVYESASTKIRLERLASSDTFDIWIAKIENAKLQEKSDDETEFQYTTVVKETRKIEGTKIEIPAGEYKNTIKMTKAPNGIWKISRL